MGTARGTGKASAAGARWLLWDILQLCWLSCLLWCWQMVLLDNLTHTRFHSTTKTRSWLTPCGFRHHYLPPFPQPQVTGTCTIYLTTRGTKVWMLQVPTGGRGDRIPLEICRSRSCQGVLLWGVFGDSLRLLQGPVFSFQYFNSHNCITFQSLPNCLLSGNITGKTQPRAANRNFRDSMIRPHLLYEQCKNNPFTKLSG